MGFPREDLQPVGDYGLASRACARECQKRFGHEKGGKRLEVAVDGSLMVNDEDLAQRAAVDGVGVAYLLLDSAAPMIRDGRLVTMLDDWMPRFSGFYLYYPTRRQIPAPLKALITFLRRCRRISAASRRT
jgi:DNA-binding transcriptional LysR family regulator